KARHQAGRSWRSGGESATSARSAGRPPSSTRKAARSACRAGSTNVDPTPAAARSQRPAPTQPAPRASEAIGPGARGADASPLVLLLQSAHVFGRLIRRCRALAQDVLELARQA